MTAEIIEWPLLRTPPMDSEKMISRAADEHMARRLAEYVEAAIEASMRRPLTAPERRPLMEALEAYEGPGG